MAYMLLWLVVHKLGLTAMLVAFDESAFTTARAATVVVDDEGEYKQRVASRLGRPHEFLEAEDTPFSCVLGVLSNECHQAAMFAIFKLEARRSPDMQSCAREFMDTTSDEGPAEPAAMMLARGDKIKLLLERAANMVEPCADRTENHIQAFRSMFCDISTSLGSSRAVQTWATVLPGQAQLWYRLFIQWQRFPYKLLLLILPSTTPEQANQIVYSLLDSRPCCVDPGLSGLLLQMAEAHSSTREGRAFFLTSPRVLALIRVWASSISVTVFGIKCLNAVFAQVAESGPCSTQRQLAKKRVAAHALVAVCPKEEVEHAWMDDVLQEEERTRDSKLLSEHKALAKQKTSLAMSIRNQGYWR